MSVGTTEKGREHLEPRSVRSCIVGILENNDNTEWSCDGKQSTGLDVKRDSFV